MRENIRNESTKYLTLHDLRSHSGLHGLTLLTLPECLCGNVITSATCNMHSDSDRTATASVTICYLVCLCCGPCLKLTHSCWDPPPYCARAQLELDWWSPARQVYHDDGGGGVRALDYGGGGLEDGAGGGGEGGGGGGGGGLDDGGGVRAREDGGGV